MCPFGQVFSATINVALQLMPVVERSFITWAINVYFRRRGGLGGGHWHGPKSMPLGGSTKEHAVPCLGNQNGKLNSLIQTELFEKLSLDKFL